MTPTPTSIASLNRFAAPERRAILTNLIPPQVFEQFNLDRSLVDPAGHDLLEVTCSPESSSIEVAIFHQHGFQDPIIFGHLADNVNGKIHVLLYIMSDPTSPRFDVDRMPDGSRTRFGTEQRNLEAELAAMHAGLVPGQVRQGLNLLREAVEAFEVFVRSMGQTLYFVEPLYYHNAVIFERYGFSYQVGRRFMTSIHTGFSPGGELLAKLGGSPFRQPEAANSIRLRSWAIHDGILEKPFTDVTMYKVVGKTTPVVTTPDVPW